MVGEGEGVRREEDEGLGKVRCIHEILIKGERKSIGDVIARHATPHYRPPTKLEFY